MAVTAAAAIAAYRANHKVAAQSVADTAADLLAQAVGLRQLQAAGKLAAVQLTGTSNTATAAQALTLDSFTGFALAPGAALTVSDTAARLLSSANAAGVALATTVQLKGVANTVTAAQAIALTALPDFTFAAGAHLVVTDTGADLAASISGLEALAKAGELTSVSLSPGDQTLTLTPQQYLASADVIGRLKGTFQLALSPNAAGLTIDVSEDASVARAPAAFRTAVTTAVALLETAISNPITVNIAVGWGEIDGQHIPAGSAEGGSSGDLTQSYAQVAQELAANVSGPAKASLALPSTDPFATSYDVASTQAKAWGLMSATGTELDGSVGVSSSGWPSSDYVGVLLHEFTHALGRSSGYGGTNADTTTLDLFRFSAPGRRVTDGSTVDPSINPKAAGLQYFSIDGGKTVLADFSNSSDYGDWTTNSLTTVDPFDAYLSSNSNALTSVDLIELGALGLKLSPTALADISGASSTTQTTLLAQAAAGLDGASGQGAAVAAPITAPGQTLLAPPH